MDYIPLEKPIADLEVKISELKRLARLALKYLDHVVSIARLDRPDDLAVLGSESRV